MSKYIIPGLVVVLILRMLPVILLAAVIVTPWLILAEAAKGVDR